jgi:hypothetical protein
MTFKNYLLKSFFLATFGFSCIVNASANWNYSVSLGYGIGLVKFNDDRGDATFLGDENVKPTLSNTEFSNSTGGGSQLLSWNVLGIIASGNDPLKGETLGTPALRTTYKYIENLPQGILHLDFGITKTFSNINLIDREFFAGAVLGFGFGKTTASKGITNPNGRYMQSGSTAHFWSANAKFGLQNQDSKIYGLLGLTYASVDLPYDILPLGTNAILGDLNTTTVMENGSSLLATIPGSTGLNIGTVNILISDLAAVNQQASAQIKPKDVTAKLLFMNIGAGLEIRIINNLFAFTEYVYLIQLDKNKTHSFDYSVGDKTGKFKGVIKTKDSNYIKVGVRYYFN